MIIRFQKKVQTILLITLLGAFTSIFMLGAKSYWVDEAFSIAIAGNPHLLSYLWLHEFNMWIYYVILHFWLLLGTSEFVVRSISAVFAIATVPLIYKLGEKLFDKRTGILAALFTALNVFFVLYAQEARAYSLALFLSVLSTYFFVRISKNENKYLLIYILTSALSVYAHLFSALIILSQFISLVFLPKKSVKLILISAIGIGGLLLPLLLAPSLHSQQTDWIRKPSLTSVIGTYVILSGDFIPLFFIESILIIVFFPWKRIKEWNHAFLLIWAIVPVLVVFILSQIIKSIYQSVYFIGLLPAYMFLTGLAFSRIKRSLLSISILILVILLYGVRLIIWYIGNDQFKTAIKNVNEDWRDSTAYVHSRAKNGDGVIFFSYYSRFPYGIYNTSPVPEPVEIASASYLIGNGSNLPEPDTRKLLSLPEKYRRVWLVLNRADGERFNREKQRKEILTALHSNYTLIETKNFNKVDLELYGPITYSAKK